VHASGGAPVVVPSENNKCEYNEYFERGKYQPLKKRFFADFFEWCHTYRYNTKFDFLKKQNYNLIGGVF